MLKSLHCSHPGNVDDGDGGGGGGGGAVGVVMVVVVVVVHFNLSAAQFCCRFPLKVTKQNH